MRPRNTLPDNAQTILTRQLVDALRTHIGKIHALQKMSTHLLPLENAGQLKTRTAGAILTRVLAALPAAERRAHPRMIINAGVYHAERPHKPIGTVRNINAQGMLVALHALGPDMVHFLAMGGTITVEGLGDVASRIVRLESDAVYVAFTGPLSLEFDKALHQLTRILREHHAAALAITGIIAEQIQQSLVRAVLDSTVELEDLLLEPSPIMAPVHRIAERACADFYRETLIPILRAEAMSLPETTCLMALQRSGEPAAIARNGQDINGPSKELLIVKSDVNCASMTFAARISPVPTVQPIQLQADQGQILDRHVITSTPILVMGQRWGAAALICPAFSPAKTSADER
jgi:hypothetical protein